jgi:hypothetical protein
LITSVESRRKCASFTELRALSECRNCSRGCFGNSISLLRYLGRSTAFADCSKLLDTQSAYTENCSTREKEAKIGSQEDWQMIDKELAGTTGLEPATSDVTGLPSRSVTSIICLCFQRLEGSLSPTRNPIRRRNTTYLVHAYFTPTSARRLTRKLSVTTSVSTFFGCVANKPGRETP